MGFDGVPLFSSSKVSMYPITGINLNLPPSIRNKKENIILIGLWVGKHKPSVDVLFEHIITDFTLFAKDGIFYIQIY